jgi:hypothetical protein
MKLLPASGAAACAAWLALLSICTPVNAQSKEAPAGARTYEDILKVIPQQDFLKLRGNRKAESAMELSKVLIQNEVDKESTFAIKIAKVEPWPFPAEGITGTRIIAEDEKIRMGSVTITTTVFVYVRATPTDATAKLRRGQKIMVTGKLSRCDVTAVESPILNIDIHTDTVTPAGK